MKFGLANRLAEARTLTDVPYRVAIPEQGFAGATTCSAACAELPENHTAAAVPTTARPLLRDLIPEMTPPITSNLHNVNPHPPQ